MTQPAKRRRLTPDQRKTEILDATYNLVLSGGITTLTMEKIAFEAKASKALLYSYYPNISGLLHALYTRELNYLQTQQLDALTVPYEFEDMVKLTSRINREHQNDRQRLIKHLEADNNLKQSMATTDQKSRTKVVEFLSQEIINNYDIPEDIASKAVRLALRYDEKEPLVNLNSSNQQDEIWGAMIVGAMQELEKRFGTKANKT